MKKIGLNLIFCCVLITNVFSDTSINQVYSRFASAFKNKKFDECLRCLSDKDFQKYKEVAKFNNVEINVDELIIKELSNIWELYYNESLKKENIKSLQESLNRDVSEMQDYLKQMKAENASKEEIEDFIKQIDNEKFNIQEESLMMQAKVNTFREIIEKKIIDDRAMIAVEFEYVFPPQLEKQAKNCFLKEEPKSQNISKIRYFNAGTLKMYYLYAFEKNFEGNWEILFFSRDQFNEIGFEDFIKKYEKNSSFYGDGEINV